jgi:hypothetical protein
MCKVLFCVAILLALVSPSTLSAQPSTGIAYDMVTKYATSNTTSLATSAAPDSYDPSTFEADYTAATQAGSHSGSIVRMYMAPSKERFDMGNVASIVDCTAKTLTTLDLLKKRYTVKSLGAGAALPQPSASPAEAPFPIGALGDMKSTTTEDTRALGRREVGGRSVDVYETTEDGTMSFSAVTMTMHSVATRYYDAETMHAVEPSCGGKGSIAAFSAVTGGIGLPLGQLLGHSQDVSSNFKVTKTGISLPSESEHMLLYSKAVATIQDAAMAMTMTVTTIAEVGHIRSITDADPAFTVPSDFTLVQSLN